MPATQPPPRRSLDELKAVASIGELLARERRARLSAERRLVSMQAELMRANAALDAHARHLASEIGPLRREADGLRGAAGRFADEARTAERRLWDALEATPDGFAIYDAGLALAAANARYLAPFEGLDEVRPGISYHRVLELVADEGIADIGMLRPEAWVASMRTRLAEDRPEPVVLRMWDGACVRLVHRRAASGDLVVLAIDVTETMEREAELEEARHRAEAASRAKSAFLANMSHELRTPLGGILGMSSLLVEEDLTEDQRQQVEVIQASGEALLAIVDDVLDLGRIEGSRLALRPAPFDPRAVIEEVVRMHRPTAMERGLALGADVDEGLPRRLVGDGGRLRQMLANLVGNAVKFTPTGQVTIRAVGAGTPAPGMVRLHVSVEDTGIGIAEADLERMFGAFEQAEGGRDRHHDGAGLGLTVTRRLLEMMGGELWADSAPGRGSCFGFRVDLPVASDPASGSGGGPDRDREPEPEPVGTGAPSANRGGSGDLVAGEPDELGDAGQGEAEWEPEPEPAAPRAVMPESAAPEPAVPGSAMPEPAASEPATSGPAEPTSGAPEPDVSKLAMPEPAAPEPAEPGFPAPQPGPEPAELGPDGFEPGGREPDGPEPATPEPDDLGTDGFGQADSPRLGLRFANGRGGDGEAQPAPTAAHPSETRPRANGDGGGRRDDPGDGGGRAGAVTTPPVEAGGQDPDPAPAEGVRAPLFSLRHRADAEPGPDAERERPAGASSPAASGSEPQAEARAQRAEPAPPASQGPSPSLPGPGAEGEGPRDPIAMGPAAEPDAPRGPSPAAPGDPAPADAARDGADGPAAAGRAMRVLAAEDNRANQMILKRMLAGLDIALVLVASGTEAVAAFARQRPDLVLMDISMPGMDGREATRRIRAAEAASGHPPVPVVAMTAHALAGDEGDIRAAGLDGYLPKPLRKAAIREVVLSHAPPDVRSPDGEAAE